MMTSTTLRGNILFLFLDCFLVNTLKYMKGYASKLPVLTFLRTELGPSL
jgi:hypothetical protein